MPSLFELLPLLDGWKPVPIEHTTPLTVQAYDKTRIIQADKPGWICEFSVTVTGSNDVSILLEWYDPEKHDDVGKTVYPKALVEAGLDSPNNSCPWVSDWDFDTGTYTLMFTPATPFPVRASSDHPKHVVVQAAGEPVKVVSYYQISIVIYDRAKFIESLKSLPEYPEITMRW